MSRSSDQVLLDAAQTLRTAELGLRLMEADDPEQRMAGLRNVAVFGRAVTNVLQNLRSTEPEFDEWYSPFVAEMRADPLLRRFYKLRSQVLKTGATGTSVSVGISNLSLPGDMSRLGQAPPGATAFFIGDQSGGTGWEVPQPDGSVEKYYVGLPSDIGTVSMQMLDPPATHLGQPVPADADVRSLSSSYVGYLQDLVRQARVRFGSGRDT